MFWGHGVWIGATLDREAFENGDKSASDVIHRERWPHLAAERLEHAVVVGAGLTNSHRVHRGQAIPNLAITMALRPHRDRQHERSVVLLIGHHPRRTGNERVDKRSAGLY